MAGDPKYLQLLDEMKELHIRKNAGYSGNSCAFCLAVLLC